jgi:electron transfer flavoprotein alpha subunit
MILVVTEHREGKFTPVSNELIVFGQRASRDLGVPVHAVVIGAAGAGMETLKAAKIDRILTIDDARVNAYDPDAYVASLRAILDRNTPSLIVAGHTTQGMDFMPRLWPFANRWPPAVSTTRRSETGWS